MSVETGGSNPAIGFREVGQFLNIEHPAFSSLRATAEVRTFEFQGLSQDSLTKLRTAISVFPESHRPKISDRIPHYQTTVISPKEDESRTHDVGTVMLAGSLGTAVGYGPIVSSLYQELGNDRDVGFALAMSSSQSRDTLEDPYVNSIEERAAQQAAIIVESLKAHPVKELLLTGYSLGGQEAIYMAPILERLIQEHGMDTKIGGLILLNPGGQFDRDWLKFIIRDVPTFNSAAREIEEKFPTDSLLRGIQERLEEARVWGDASSIARLERQMDEMTVKYTDPQDLPDAVRQNLLAIDGELSWTEDPRTTSSLLKQRHKLLIPVVQSIFNGSDAREDLGRLKFAKAVKRVGRATTLRRRPITRQMPSWIREINTYPTAVMLGENDPYFPAARSRDMFFDMFRDGVLPYPNASVFDIATVDNGAHAGVVVEPQKYTGIVVDLYAKLQQEATEPGQVSTGPNIHSHHY